MVEKVRKTLDEGGGTGDVLTEWFDCIDYNLLLARLNAYGFEKQSIDFTYSHITKRKQRAKVEYADSSSQMFFFRSASRSFRTTFIQYVCLWRTRYRYSSNIENALDSLQGE